MQATYLKAKVNNLKGCILECKKREVDLNRKVDSLKAAAASGDKKLKRFYRKLSRIREGLTKEVDKVSNHQDGSLIMILIKPFLCR